MVRSGLRSDASSGVTSGEGERADMTYLPDLTRSVCVCIYIEERIESRSRRRRRGSKLSEYSQALNTTTTTTTCNTTIIQELKRQSRVFIVSHQDTIFRTYICTPPTPVATNTHANSPGWTHASYTCMLIPTHIHTLLLHQPGSK